MFTWNSRDATRKFPPTLIYQSRFRGAHHFVLTPAEARDDTTGTEPLPNEPHTPLGVSMRDLFRCTWSSEKGTESCQGVVEDALKRIADERKIQNIDEQYRACVETAAQRDLKTPYPYDLVTQSSDMGNLWGITQQLRFGLLVSRILFDHQKTSLCLDPVFGSLLNPMGGVLGSPPRWIHSPTFWQDGPLRYQRVCKDAEWYLYLYHQLDLSKSSQKYSGVLSWYWIDLCVKKMPMWY